MRIPAILAAAIGVLAVLAGCTSLPAGDAREAGARALVEIATMAAIEKSADRAATAAKVVAAAKDAKSWLDLSGVTLDELANRARERIAASSAELSEKAALNALVNVIALEVSQQAAVGTIDPSVKVRVNKLLDWIIGAAQAYTS